MWYHYTLTVPAGTTESIPVVKWLKLTDGVITHISVGFPSGCKQLVKVRIEIGKYQLFPANPDEPASWNAGIEGGDEHYKLDTVPYMLKAIGYAPLSTVSHDITIFISVLPVEVAEPWTAQTSILDRLKSVFGLG